MTWLHGWCQIFTKSQGWHSHSWKQIGKHWSYVRHISPWNALCHQICNTDHDTKSWLHYHTRINLNYCNRMKSSLFSLHIHMQLIWNIVDSTYMIVEKTFGFFFIYFMNIILGHWFDDDSKLPEALHTVATWPVTGTSIANYLTHWGRNKMVAVLQTIFWNAFFWLKMYEFWLKFHWNVFYMV